MKNKNIKRKRIWNLEFSRSFSKLMKPFIFMLFWFCVLWSICDWFFNIQFQCHYITLLMFYVWILHIKLLYKISGCHFQSKLKKIRFFNVVLMHKDILFKIKLYFLKKDNIFWEKREKLSVKSDWPLRVGICLFLGFYM